jgi:hypothetical protein
VLIPLETATAGVQKEAFLSAARLARALCNGGPLLVLGPTFSGSATSFHRAIQSAADDGIVEDSPAGAGIEVVSGSATLLAIRQIIEKGYECPGKPNHPCGKNFVRFHSMMASDRETLPVLASFLGAIDADWKQGRRMAWLVESNTGWGQGIMRDQAGKNQDDPQSAANTRRASECSNRPYFPCARILPFPLHISRLRTTAAEEEGNRTAAAAPDSKSLRHDDDASFGDRIPPMRPALTAAMAEASLDTIFATLETLDVTAVGLFGTDDRDKLFLAEQLRRRAPNVLLFTLDGSLAYIHPDYRSYTRGTLIASSYPLFGLTQALLPQSAKSTMRVQQFPAATAQGVYNGLLALLGKADKTLSYGEGCSPEDPDKCHPDVWISVVGEDAIWPLRREALQDNRSDNGEFSWPGRKEVTAAEPDDAGQRSDARHLEPNSWLAPLRWPTLAVVVFAGTALALALHLGAGLAVVVSLLGPRTRMGERLSRALHRWLPLVVPPDVCAARWNAPLDPTRRVRLRQEYWLSLLACGGSLLAVVALVSHLRAVGLNVGADPDPSALCVAKATFFRLALGCSFVAGAVASLWPTSARRQATPWPVTVVRTLAAGLGVIALGCLEWSFRAPQWTGPLAGINAQRYALLGNMVSPVLPVLLFSAIVYSWGVWNLWRLHQLAASFGPENTATALLAAEYRSEASGLADALDSPTLDIRGPAALLLLLLAALQALVSDRFCATPDGKALGGVLIAGTMLVTLLVGHTLSHCLHLGGTVLGALQALERHPIGDAFARLRRLPGLWGISDGAARAAALPPLVRRARALALAIREQAMSLERTGVSVVAESVGSVVPVLAVGPGGSIEASPEHRRAPDATGDVVVDEASRILGKAMQIRATDVVWLQTPPAGASALHESECLPRPLHAAPAWRELERWSAVCRRALERGPWARQPFPSTDATALPHLAEAETLLALQVSFALRQLIVRLTKGLTFAAAGLVLLLAAHLLYCFQGRAFWLGLDWALLGLGTLVILYLFIRLEKDPVLSRIWATRPGHLDWNGVFFQRILFYGAIPVVMLFVTFFPEVGSALFGWLEPVQKSLP